MLFSRPVTELIPTRRSVRTFTAEPCTEGEIGALEAFVPQATGPFGSEVVFKIVSLPELPAATLSGLGTYGMIRGANTYLIGSVKSSLNALVDFGYAFELMVLKAHDLGLGSCWLGGSFTRSTFSELHGLHPNHIMPCIAPIGHARGAVPMRDRAIRILSRSARRQPWDRLFFDGDPGNPLTLDAAGALATPLEMLRLAPSASNRQPWRAIRSGASIHFYRQRGLLYQAALRVGGFPDLQLVDLGIALCHFEISARESGLEGALETMGDAPRVTGLDYIATWRD